MRRRRFLATAGAALPVALAGCNSFRSQSAAAELPTASLDMRPEEDTELPGRVLYTADDPDSERGALVEAAVDGGTSIEGTRPLLPEDRRIAGPDGVYELSYEVVDRTPATAFSVVLDIVEGTVAEERSVRFADLPAVDRETFAERGYDEGEVVGIGTTLLYTDAAAEQSELVPESPYDYITWENGNAAEWAVDGRFDRTLKRYRYTGERVDSLAGYGKRLRERFAFDLAPRSPAERDIVEQAIEDRYVLQPGATPSEAVDSLAETFREQPSLRALEEEPEGGSRASGTYLVRYDGRVYLASFGYHARERSATATA